MPSHTTLALYIHSGHGMLLNLLLSAYLKNRRNGLQLCMTVRLQLCRKHYHLPLQAFKASYDSFFFATSFFALIISTWHRIPAFHSVAKGTCKCLSTWTFQALQDWNKKGTKPPVAFVKRPPSAVDHQIHVPLESTSYAT